MKKFSRVLGVAALLVMATAGPAMAARPPDHLLPIKGSVLALDNGQIFPTPDQPLDCPDWAEWQFFSRGVGQVSHLGRAELDVVQCSMVVAPPGTIRSEGTTTLTAANGDMLILAHELDVETQYTNFPVPDGWEGEGTWTVVGGTGRFALASGSGTVTAVGDIPTDDTPWQDLPAGSTSWTFNGMIEYDASNRAVR